MIYDNNPESEFDYTQDFSCSARGSVPLAFPGCSSARRTVRASRIRSAANSGVQGGPRFRRHHAVASPGQYHLFLLERGTHASRQREARPGGGGRLVHHRRHDPARRAGLRSALHCQRLLSSLYFPGCPSIYRFLLRHRSRYQLLDSACHGLAGGANGGASRALVAQYRSLIVNSAPEFDQYPSGSVAGPQIAGAGKLDLLGALQGGLTASPTSLNFLDGHIKRRRYRRSIAGGERRFRSSTGAPQTVTITNVGAASDTFSRDRELAGRLGRADHRRANLQAGSG